MILSAVVQCLMRLRRVLVLVLVLVQMELWSVLLHIPSPRIRRWENILWPALVRSKASAWFSMCHQGDQTTVRQIRGAKEGRLFQSHPKSLARPRTAGLQMIRATKSKKVSTFHFTTPNMVIIYRTGFHHPPQVFSGPKTLFSVPR